MVWIDGVRFGVVWFDMVLDPSRGNIYDLSRNRIGSPILTYRGRYAILRVDRSLPPGPERPLMPPFSASGLLWTLVAVAALVCAAVYVGLINVN